MALPHGFMHESDVANFVINATDDKGVVNALKLVSDLSERVNPSDTNECVNVAWEMVKREWRTDWPAPIGVEPDDDEVREIGRRLLVSVTVAKVVGGILHYEAIASAVESALVEVGVGTGLRLDVRTIVRVSGE